MWFPSGPGRIWILNIFVTTDEDHSCRRCDLSKIISYSISIVSLVSPISDLPNPPLSRSAVMVLPLLRHAAIARTSSLVRARLLAPVSGFHTRYAYSDHASSLSSRPLSKFRCRSSFVILGNSIRELVSQFDFIFFFLDNSPLTFSEVLFFFCVVYGGV